MKKRMGRTIVLFAAVMCLSCLWGISTSAKTYTISPKTKPCDNTQRAKNYNKYTKHYFLLRSYLMKIEKQGGGKLVLKKGTYKISNTIYVPSNTQIVLKNGVTLKKLKNSGAKDMPAASSMFQFISWKKAKKTGVYGKYKGEKNISLIGKGKAVIDLGKLKMNKKDVIGIIMGHNQKVTIEGITFKNMRYGHMIEMDASKNVTVKNCTFTGFKASGKHNKEAINLDTPDKKRDGFKSKWSKKDGTPNINVVIENCTFRNLEAGVGTHQYTGNKYHTNVTIQNCSFDKVQTAIRVLNWKNATITKNTFSNCSPNARYPYAMFFAGVQGMQFSYNTFTNCGVGDKLLEFWCDKGYDAKQTIYDATYSEITEEQAAVMLTTNTAVNCGYCKIYNSPYYVDFTAPPGEE